MLRKIMITFSLVLVYAGLALGAISQEEAKKLGTTLTETGAEKAGNADGSIPPYTGGITREKDGFYFEGKLRVPFSKYDSTKTGLRPDPFADDKVKFSVNAKNMNQYADKLTEGTKALMKKYPDFRIDVYPTRRSMSFPKYVKDNTIKAATTAKITKPGLAFTGAKAGFPFPIPKSGEEVLWNHMIHYSGTAWEYKKYRGYMINASGRPTMTTESYALFNAPYWDEKTTDGSIYQMIYDAVSGPANRNGERLIWKMYIDKDKNPDPAWQYLPGQRRVKLAPEIGYDTPMTTVAGAATYDDFNLLTGKFDRHNWKIIGKKEMIVPYNTYKKLYHSTAEQILKKHFINPDFTRFELHRVWVVEGTLKPGKRHLYSKRVLYIDEDSWCAAASENYDGQGQLYRTMYSNLLNNYDGPAPYMDAFEGYDLISGIYFIDAYTAEFSGIMLGKLKPESFWAPSSMGGSGIR